MTSPPHVAPSSALSVLAARDVRRDAQALRQARYAEIQRDHGRGLRRVVCRYARTEAEQEDLVQDLALAIWDALLRFREEASLRTFAFRIAHNRSISHLRRRRSTSEEREVVDDTPCAQRVLEEKSDRERLMIAIEALPLGLQQVLTLNLEGMSYVEVGEVLGISEKNVSVRLTRARKALRKRLGGES